MERIYPAEEIEEEIRALEFSVQVKKEVESTIEETSMLGKGKKAWDSDVVRRGLYAGIAVQVAQ